MAIDKEQLQKAKSVLRELMILHKKIFVAPKSDEYWSVEKIAEYTGRSVEAITEVIEDRYYHHLYVKHQRHMVTENNALDFGNEFLKLHRYIIALAKDDDFTFVVSKAAFKSLEFTKKQEVEQPQLKTGLPRPSEKVIEKIQEQQEKERPAKKPPVWKSDQITPAGKVISVKRSPGEVVPKNSDNYVKILSVATDANMTVPAFRSFMIIRLKNALRNGVENNGYAEQVTPIELFSFHLTQYGRRPDELKISPEMAEVIAREKQSICSMRLVKDAKLPDADIHHLVKQYLEAKERGEIIRCPASEQDGGIYLR